MVTIDETRLARFLAEAHLVSGQGKGANGTIDVCVVQATDWLTGGNGQTDAPSCVDPAIRAFAIGLNDAPRFSQWRDELKPYAVKMANTNHGRELTKKRGFLCADWAVRVMAPHGMETIAQFYPWCVKEYATSAAELRAVAPMVDRASAAVGREVAWKVRTAFYKAAAADAAAYAAAADAAAYAADAYAAAAASAAYAADAVAYSAKSSTSKRRAWEMALAHLDALCEASL